MIVIMEKGQLSELLRVSKSFSLPIRVLIRVGCEVDSSERKGNHGYNQLFGTEESARARS